MTDKMHARALIVIIRLLICLLYQGRDGAAVIKQAEREIRDLTDFVL